MRFPLRHRFILAALLGVTAVSAVGGAGVALHESVIPIEWFAATAGLAVLVVLVVVARLQRSVAVAIDALGADVTRLATAVGSGQELGLALANPADEQFGPLVRAVNTLTAETESATVARLEDEVREVESDVATGPEIRDGLAGIVIDLARRSQTLLDRQVEFIDRLEHREHDPDRLSQLFTVDHLATRMRRNAESLLVLAGADPPRRRGGPIDIDEVIRVAVGEIENYQHIEFDRIEAGSVASGTAVDLAHLAAELMENATQFSPPDRAVCVAGVYQREATYMISIVDRGMGMTADQMAEANRVLADPPELGLDMGRSLGFAVVGRLAARLGAEVALDETTGGGVTARVTFPDRLFVGGGIRPGPPAAPTPSEPTPADPISASPITASPITGHHISGEPDRPERSASNGPAGDDIDPFSMLGHAPPTFERQPAGGDLDGEIGGEVHDVANPSAPATWEPPSPPERAEYRSADDPRADTGNGAHGEDEAGGLLRRTRGASRIPVGEGRPVVAGSRSPDEVRSMLSRYWHGMRSGKEAVAKGAAELDTGRGSEAHTLPHPVDADEPRP